MKSTKLIKGQSIVRNVGVVPKHPVGVPAPRIVATRPFVGLTSSASSSVRGASLIAHGFGLKLGAFGKKGAEPKTCDCGSKMPYEECCGKFHAGKATPQTPEELMRSRYSAYCRSLVDYVVNTTHPSNPSFNGSTSADGKVKTTLKADVMATCRTCKFEKLKVVSTEDGSNADEGFVTFKAEFKIVGQKGDRQQGSKLQVLEERSRFIREDGKWFYADGENNWDAHSYEKKLEDAVKKATNAGAANKQK